MRGKVKNWSAIKGTGWIVPDMPLPQGGDIWVHFSDIEGRESGRINLFPGDVVEFRIDDVGKGPRAFDVRRVRG